jgi:hypothetical protein
LSGVLAQGIVGFSETAGFHVQTVYLQYLHPSVFGQNLPNVLSQFLLLTGPTSQTGFGVISVLVPCISFLAVLSRNKKVRGLSGCIAIVALFFLVLELLVINQNPIVNSIYADIPFLLPINGFEAYTALIGSLVAVLFPIGIDTVVGAAVSNKKGVG